MNVPDPLFERIVASIESGCARDSACQGAFSLCSVCRQSGVGPRYERRIGAHIGSSQIAVRNRDGITPPSIAGAVWLILDSLIKVSPRAGLPWPRGAAKTLEAYADRTESRISGWVANPDDLVWTFLESLLETNTRSVGASRYLF